ncbi:MAG: alpha-glucosidase [Anaerolineaceae bacterium]
MKNMEKHTWWKEAVGYQIYPKSFCDSNADGVGDINGILSKLDYLKWLGVDILWLSPVYPSPGFDNGYDISDYDTIGEQYGSEEDFAALLKEAHGLGLRVIMDLVVNHTSDLHPWFIESRTSRDNSKRDFYIWRDGKNGGCPNNWKALFGGPAWTLDESSGQYYLHLFSSRQPDLNWENDAVREEIHAIMRRWLDKGVDGFRMDVISLIAKPAGLPDIPNVQNDLADPRALIANTPRVHDYLREMRQKVLRHYDLVAVGEASGVTLNEARIYTAPDGSELDMIFQFEHMDLDGGETFKWNDKRIPLVQLKEVMAKWQQGLEGSGWNALFWSNHDQPRMVSRLGDEGRYWERSAKILATCLLMMKGTPFIYQGEEIGMLNMPFENPDQLRDIESLNAYTRYTQSGQITKDDMMRYIRLKGRDNARTPMQWEDTRNAGFSEGSPWIDVNPSHKRINVNEQMVRDDSVLSYHRQLLVLRKQHEVLVYGRYDPLALEDAAVFAFTRSLGDEVVLVACNFSNQEVRFDMPLKSAADIVHLIGNNADSTYLSTNLLQPYEAVVLLGKSQEQQSIGTTG